MATQDSCCMHKSTGTTILKKLPFSSPSVSIYPWSRAYLLRGGDTAWTPEGGWHQRVLVPPCPPHCGPLFPGLLWQVSFCGHLLLSLSFLAQVRPCQQSSMDRGTQVKSGTSQRVFKIPWAICSGGFSFQKSFSFLFYISGRQGGGLSYSGNG